jgi:hypothetical protein
MIDVEAPNVRAERYLAVIGLRTLLRSVSGTTLPGECARHRPAPPVGHPDAAVSLMSMKRWLLRAGGPVVASVLLASPTLGQTPHGLPVGGAAVVTPVATPGTVSLASVQWTVPETRLVTLGDVHARTTPRRVATGSPVPIQSQESSGFPWLEVGIGAGVAALLISAVLTANSGDSAGLPSGGIRVVLPGS